MALTRSRAGDLTSAVGLDPATDAPFPLGHTTWSVPEPSGGQHLVGVDDGFSSPIVMRACFQADAPKYDGAGPYVGYVQLLQVAYDGVPIPPSAFGGQMLGREALEVWVGPDHGNHVFIDALAPADAVPRVDRVWGLPPFAAWNVATRRAVSAWTELTRLHDVTTGSFHRWPGPLLSGELAGPTIVAELPVGLLTESAIRTAVGDDGRRAHDWELAVTPAEVAATPFHELVLATLTAPGGDLEGVARRDMGGWAQGRYVMIQAPDDEDMGATYCMRLDPWPTGAPPTRVLVWALEWHEMVELRARTVAAAMRSMAAAAAAEPDPLVPSAPDAVVQAASMATDRTGRGRSGFGVPDRLPARPPVTITATTFVAMPGLGSRAGGRLHFQTGFRWGVELGYDPDRSDLFVTSIIEPTGVGGLDATAVQRAYEEALNRPSGPIDTTGFTHADLRRSGFGMGRWRERA